LAVDALFGAHDVAMAELKSAPLVSLPTYAHRQIAAVVYEAIYRYATIGPFHLRVAAVAPLIAPLFTKIESKPWASPINNQREPQDAVATDQNFAAFLAVASVSAAPEIIVLPCGALVRRPGLIDVLQPYYGGAIDGSLIGTSVTPPLYRCRCSMLLSKRRTMFRSLVRGQSAYRSGGTQRVC
jgi:hypothetical protein